MQSAKLGAILGSPSSPQMLRREQRELRCVSFWATCCSDFDGKTMILGVPAPLCTGLGQGLETGVQKNHFGTKPVSHFGDIFRVFRHFLTFDFSFIFEVTSDSELYALWCRKGAQKEVFGEPFRSDFEVSGESENEAPV